MRQERKVVTCLFCDLVGFTQRAEEMDPEDVAALLGPYHARLKDELERYGGTVEKFIGDAVMALFGAPVAHEDDPERAVRAALAIRDFAEEEGVELRIGITTGEAIVNLDVRPESGETMATGDVVNTAARLQAAAPVNGILVSEKTYEATKQAIDYGEGEPVEAKGKAQPVLAWAAISARARIAVDRLHERPFVGRVRELSLLIDTLRHARNERSPQLVTLIGVPGIGKSRLVYELSQAVEADLELISWRQGRCLPYGDGVTFWALGEIVKAQAGILDSDGPEEAEHKLHRAASDAWVEGHLRPLVGLTVDGDVGGDRRTEAFAAWRQFFETLAEERPLVLVVEDLHWADESLLDFLDHLVDWSSGVPLLVVCTARPELLERRPGWGGGKSNALALSLSPLSEQETARLVTALLERPLLEAETQAALLARAGGNPLYAEQFARMIRERGEREDLPLPETVQGIIAARLDGLSGEQKSLLQNAAVLGKVFWTGALASLSGLEPRELEERLHALERKEFVRRERQSTVEGEGELAFRHLLVRDVAYGQIPRADRAGQHRLAAEWIESLGRPDDHAELIAYHYERALEYSRAAGAGTEEIAEKARYALRDAGERAVTLGAFPAAERFYEQAVELWPSGDPERPHVLFQYGYALAARNEGEEVLADARDGLLAAGDVDRAAEAEVMLGLLARLSGRGEDAVRHNERAAELVEGRSPSTSIAFVLSTLARQAMVADENEKAIEIGGRALTMAEELGLDQLRGGVLAAIGPARIHLGDLSGVHDLERSIEILEAARSEDAGRGYQNLGSIVAELGDLRRALELTEQALEVRRRFGHAVGMRFTLGNRVDLLFSLGQWDEALAESDRFLAEVDAGTPHYQEAAIRCVRAQIRFARSDVAGGLADAETALARAREVGDSQLVHPTLSIVGLIFLEAGRQADAETVADELVQLTPGLAAFGTFAVFLTELGRSGDVLAVAEAAVLQTPWVEAARAYAKSDLARAADVLDEIGDRSTEAYVRLKCADQLVAEGRRVEGDEQLRKALAFYRSVSATRYIREAEALLAASA